MTATCAPVASISMPGSRWADSMFSFFVYGRTQQARCRTRRKAHMAFDIQTDLLGADELGPNRKPSGHFVLKVRKGKSLRARLKRNLTLSVTVIHGRTPATEPASTTGKLVRFKSCALKGLQGLVQSVSKKHVAVLLELLELLVQDQLINVEHNLLELVRGGTRTAHGASGEKR